MVQLMNLQPTTYEHILQKARCEHYLLIATQGLGVDQLPDHLKPQNLSYPINFKSWFNNVINFFNKTSIFQDY